MVTMLNIFMVVLFLMVICGLSAILPYAVRELRDYINARKEGKAYAQKVMPIILMSVGITIAVGIILFFGFSLALCSIC